MHGMISGGKVYPYRGIRSSTGEGTRVVESDSEVLSRVP